MFTFPTSPLLSMRLAVFTVSPQISYWNFFIPTIPATTGPVCGLIYGEHGKDGGFIADSGEEIIANITPSALALNLYTRCNASSKTTAEYWAKELKSSDTI